MRFCMAILALGMIAMAAPAGAPADEADRLVASLGSADRAEASRAEARLISLGGQATPALGRYLALEQRDDRVVEAIYRVITRGGDLEATRFLWPEWQRSPSLREALIKAWGAHGDAGVSPLANYFQQATPSQQELIIETLAPIGEPAVPALGSMREIVLADSGGMAARLRTRIEEVLQAAPVVTLAARGPAAVVELERIANDPLSSPPAARAALRGLAGIASGSRGDEAALALRRITRGRLPPDLRAEAEALADDAWLMSLGRRGEAAMPDYEAILRDPGAREPLSLGAVNALFGLGVAALPSMEKAARSMKPGPTKEYLAQLTATLRAMKPAASASLVPLTPPPGPPAPDPSAGPACSGGHKMIPIATINAAGRPISPRWFRRTADRSRIVYTTVESGYYRLIAAGADGAATVTLAPLAHSFAPDPSWDSKRLVFLGTDEIPGRPILRNDVYSAGWDGQGPRRLSATSGTHCSPVWLTQREEVIYARNELDAKDAGGRPMAQAILFRSPDQASAARELARLDGQIITAIEASPDVLRIAFLAWKVASPSSESAQVTDRIVYLSSIDGSGRRAVELGIPQAGTGRWSDPLSVTEALALGGDLTWSADGRLLTAAGRLIDAQSGQITMKLDPATDGYIARLSGRGLLTEGDTCVWFNDTRQVCKTCLTNPAVQILADCRGALLWHDEKKNALALFDPLSGQMGFVSLPRRRPAPAAPAR